MNEFTSAAMAAKKQAGVNIHLFSDDHPDTTVKGTGFKDETTAHRTLELISAKPRNRQVWTVNAMLNRAKHHPAQTNGMRGAMEVYERWMAVYRAEKELAKGGTKRPPPREELERQYKQLFDVEMPVAAVAGRWPVHLNHCLMRVALDGYWQCCWYEKLDQKRGALKSITAPQIENVLALGRRMLAEGKPYVAELNQRSLRYRGKAKRKRAALGGPLAQAAAAEVAKRIAPCPAAAAAAPQEPGGGGGAEPSKPQLELERAKSGRATCKGCAALIGKGEWRLGLPVWVGGRKVTVWQHPGCALARSVAVERAANGKARQQ